MRDVFEAANDIMSIYAMDQRATGRSAKLDCSKDNSTEQDVVNCFNKIKHGRYAPKAFSVTNAATDLKMFIGSGLFNKTDVYVYGVSYGTEIFQKKAKSQGHAKLSGVASETMYGWLGDRDTRLTRSSVSKVD
ncbi:hypothetical protein AC1031_018367 [Aphanomyces cochlioides]|nr:hypothetical protein AC1031_018367 [Aphanomyces cochlioides]